MQSLLQEDRSSEKKLYKRSESRRKRIRSCRESDGARGSEHLKNVFEEFLQTSSVLREYLEIFPYTEQGEMPEEKRKQGAELLLKAKPHELKAIKHLKNALKTPTGDDTDRLT